MTAAHPLLAPRARGFGGGPWVDTPWGRTEAIAEIAVAAAASDAVKCPGGRGGVPPVCVFGGFGALGAPPWDFGAHGVRTWLTPLSLSLSLSLSPRCCVAGQRGEPARRQHFVPLSPPPPLLRCPGERTLWGSPDLPTPGVPWLGGVSGGLQCQTPRCKLPRKEVTRSPLLCCLPPKLS